MDQFSSAPIEGAVRKQAPASREAERSVIGAMMIDPTMIIPVMEYVSGDQFYEKIYGSIFDIIAELYNAGLGVDPVTIVNRMREMDLPEETCNEDYLAEIIRSVPFSANATSYAKIVAEKAVLRKLIKSVDEIASECYEQSDSLEDVLNRAEHRVFDLLQRSDNSEYEEVHKVVSRVLDRIEAASKTKGTVTGIASGFTDLDAKTSGFQNSDLILLAARPSMGKTAFALNIAKYVVDNLGQAAVVFSLEMPREQLVQRMLAMDSHVDAQVLRNGSLTDSDWISLEESAVRLGRTKLIIDDSSDLNVSKMRSKCRKYKIEHDIKLIIVDYLQLMSGSGRSESRQLEISEISRSLKGLARELNVPVIALSQLSRAVEKREDKRPILSDLRESGAIEQDADVVMFLYRDEVYNKDTEKKNIAEVIIAKQRNGPIGTVDLMWLAQYTQFANLSRMEVNE
ncbi:MAG: replicative DNA helicase [Eubacterium sp.]|nr:replicative DNA helicase [Eubacterium sp.]